MNIAYLGGIDTSLIYPLEAYSFVFSLGSNKLTIRPSEKGCNISIHQDQSFLAGLITAKMTLKAKVKVISLYLKSKSMLGAASLEIEIYRALGHSEEFQAVRCFNDVPVQVIQNRAILYGSVRSV